MKATLKNSSWVLQWIVVVVVFRKTLSIYVPNEIDQTPKPYTTGIKIKTAHYKSQSDPYYHSNYSKVYVHNKNYTSSLLDSASNPSRYSSNGQSTKLYPVYISEQEKEKIKNVLKEHNTNVVEKDMLNNRVVYKRRIEKTKNIEVYNKCPKGVTGQFVYDLSCNQYLDCWSGRGGPRNCAPGTLFNPKTLECDFPEKVECLTGYTASALTLQKTAKYQNYEQAKCPDGFSGLIPNYTDCTRFIQCNSGIQTPGTCPPGTLFDTNLNVCNHPQQTTCFSGQSGTSYYVKEEYGGSTAEASQYQGPSGQHQGQFGQYASQSGQYNGQSGQYKGQSGQYQGQNLQYYGQSGHYISQNGQYQGQSRQHRKQDGMIGSGQTGQFLGQSNYLGQGQLRDTTYEGQLYQAGGRQYQGANECDPTNPYCNSGGYIISGQNIYWNPESGATFAGGSTSSSNFEQGTQYYGGCDPETLICQPPFTATSYDQGSLNQYNKGHSKGAAAKTGSVYIQYVMCNPVVEDCSNFQQGTFMLGPRGTLCNPLKQQCNQSAPYIPSSKMNQQPSNVPSAGTYYVRYVMCSPTQEDCSQYQKGIVEATYGVPGTLIGAQPVQSSSQGAGVGRIPAECDPQIYNCDTIQFVGQNRPGITTYDHISNGQGQTGQGCNPQYQNCNQGSLSSSDRDTQVGYQGRYPKKFNSSTNYKKICRAGDSNCYQTGYTVPTKTHIRGTHGGSDVDPKCPEGFQGITKHPTNCKKFLNCANGITYVQDCAPGTLFNPFISTCDFPYNVDCEDGDAEESTTIDYSDVIYQGQQGTYDKIQGGSFTSQGGTTCQGSQCSQSQGYGNGQHYGGQNQNQGRFSQGGQGQFQGQIGNGYGQINCQGSQCNQFGQGTGQIPGTYQQGGCQGSQCGYIPQSQGQSQGQGQTGNNYGQQPVNNCYGSNCVYQQGQGKPQPTQGQPQGQFQINYENQKGQSSCQGSQCVYRPQGSLNPSSSCQGNQCQPNQVHQGYATPSPQGNSGSHQGHTVCQGQQCGSNQGQHFPNQYPTGQVYDAGDETTTQRPYSRPTQRVRRPGGQGQEKDSTEHGSHIMKIPKDPYQATPINKDDRATYGGFDNQKSVDYVDIFDPGESRNFGYATTTRKPAQKPAKQVWPPPFPDFPTSDPNADYIFEYEDGEPVTLAPEKVNTDKRKKTRCDENDFVCDKKSCVAKSLVCDGVRDCDDGKDEKYCQKYLDEFKPYKNSRLDVLERQRWDNVSHATCALLCMDNQKFECKSYNYRKVDRACFLTNENIGTSGALKNYYPCDYYERKAMSQDCSDMHKCPNGKCLTSDQICDGYDDCGDRADEKECRPEDFGYKVKLAGGEGEHEGRVEVTVFGKTGYICDDQFSIIDAEVLCKELGFHLGAAEVKGNSYYAKDLKENHTLYMMDDIECFGNETSIMYCNFAGWGIHNCADKEIAGVVCKTPQESCSEGFWKCDSGNECVKLPFLCDDLDDCTDSSDEAPHHCNSPTELRLVNGTRPSEGRLEIRHHGIWGSICDDDFNEDAAKIVCRSLGFSGSAFVRKDAYFGQSSGPIWLDQVSCFGNETSLEKCTHWDWGDHNCDHSEDVGVVCSNEFREVEAQRNSKAVGDGVNSAIRNSGTTNLSPEPVNCGYRKDNIFLQGDDVHFRVVQGSVARPGDYPWQAALRIKGQEKSAHWCGAVVISSRWVLTAAHCLEGYPKGAYVVVAGEYNMDEDEGTEQQAFIEEYYLHENFRQGHKMGNDIAMIKVKGNGFKLNQDIQPICLPEENSNYERELNCTISGFGTVQTGKSAYSHKLRAAWIPVQKMDVCKMAHIYGEAIGDGMICAGDLNGGVDACDGDSGGPLACLEDGVFTLYGLTSWGQRCGYANKPGVYVKVSYYKKWIDNIIKVHS